jgi:hypothetical protein
VNNLAVVIPQMLWFSPVSVIVSTLHMYAFIHHWHSVTLADDSIADIHKCDIYIIHRGDFWDWKKWMIMAWKQCIWENG